MGSHQSSKSKTKMSGKGAFYKSHRQYFEFFRNLFDLQLLKHALFGVSAKIQAAVSRNIGLKSQIIACETSKLNLFQTFLYQTSNFEGSPFLSQLT